MYPKVSVIIPAHNAGPWLGECLESVLAQTLRELEVICIDDASTDNTLSIINAYAERDPRIRVVEFSENLGSGPARNKGIGLATGEFLAFCDADDAYTPAALETLYAKAKSAGVEIAGGNMRVMDAQLRCIRPLNVITAATVFYEDGVREIDDYPPLWVPWYHPRYIFSAAFLKNNAVYYPSLIRGQDPPFLAKAFCLAKGIAVCPDLVYLYRTLPNGKTMSMPQWLGYLKSIDTVFSILSDSGHAKSACLYFMFTSRSWLEPRRLLRLSSDEYQTMRGVLGGLLQKMSACGVSAMSFAPYLVQRDYILNECDLVYKGRWHFLKIKIWRKARAAKIFLWFKWRAISFCKKCLRLTRKLFSLMRRGVSSPIRFFIKAKKEEAPINNGTPADGELFQGLRKL